MGGKIDCYIDIVSFYSYVAFLQFRKDEALLRDHGVEVEFHPVYLPAILKASGNQPPWHLTARGTYLNHDARRVIAYINHPEITVPDLTVVGNTILPLRALHHIKTNYPPQTFLATLTHLFSMFWSFPNQNLTLADVLSANLLDSGLFTGGKEEVGRIMEAAKGGEEAKGKLRRSTEEALGRGAYGAPWLWMVREGDGEKDGEPVFGSDRFQFVYGYFGLPFSKMELLPRLDKGPRL